jgi:hypothetical protein
MHARLAAFFFLLCFKAVAQTHKIDSLKRSLASYTGAPEVDVFNQVAEQYHFHWIHSDSALKYSGIALQNAFAIKYDAGRVRALITQGGVYGRLLGQPDRMVEYSRQAIEIAGSGKDLKVLSRAYYSLSNGLALLGKYDVAIEAAQKASETASEAKDKYCIGYAHEVIGFAYCKSGYYWKAFEHFMQAQRIGKEINDSLLTSLSLAFVARSFNRAGDPGKALAYYHESLQYATPFLLLWPHLEDMAYAHMQLRHYDSALYYQKRHRDNVNFLTTDPIVRKKFAASSWAFSTDIQLERKQYDAVLAGILPELEHLRKNGDIIPLMHSIRVLGRVYEEQGNYQKSLQYARELYQLALHTKNSEFLKNSTQLLYNVFDRLKRADSAYKYFKEYSAINDEMETAQYAGRTALYLAASESENKIRLLKKDKAIGDQQLALNKKELQKQAQLKNLLGGGLLILFLFSLVIFRNIILKRKNEKLRNEHEQSTLKRKALELEMQALRAQMNPHFIFNCLSAIDNLIQTNQPDKATTCLSRFAKLIRGVLDSSKNNLVLFQKDFETLKLYLEMEQFRCNNKFAYELHADDELLHSDYKVPPLIIQPFIENAIHHGLLNKQDNNRQLKVDAQLKDEHIVYSITDNGIGRKKAAIIKELNRPGQKSYGIEITKERIQLHNKNGISSDMLITDLEQEGKPVGTEAIVRINCFQ